MSLPKAFAPGLYAGGQPSPEELAALAAQGVRTVINLRAPSEPAGYDEPGVAARLGLRYVCIPIAGADDVTFDAAARFSRELAEAARHGGTLVHCASSNRVGAMVALDHGLAKGSPCERALAIGRAAGLTALQPRVESLLGQAARSDASVTP